MAKKISLTNGFSAINIPEDVRVTGVLLDGVRLPYRLTKERKIETREKVTGVAEVTFEKVKQTTLKPVEVAQYYPLEARP